MVAASRHSACRGGAVSSQFRTSSGAPPMNPHLNVFTRYQRPDHHEDQLTRAAMIVMRLVPAAREGFLRLIDAPGLAQLGSVGDVDMQTQDLIGQGDAGDEIKELISVFLTPDETRDDAGDSVESAP